MEHFKLPVKIHILHTRVRLVDFDNLSAKAAIDGLVLTGVLTNDTPKQVAEVSHRQTKGRTEETTFVIELL